MKVWKIRLFIGRIAAVGPPTEFPLFFPRLDPNYSALCNTLTSVMPPASRTADASDAAVFDERMPRGETGLDHDSGPDAVVVPVDDPRHRSGAVDPDAVGGGGGAAAAAAAHDGGGTEGDGTDHSFALKKSKILRKSLYV